MVKYLFFWPVWLLGVAGQQTIFLEHHVSSQSPLRDDSTTRPNIVFILTDDQDLHMNSLEYLPSVQRHLLQQGTFYKRHFCTVALCCPSRVSLWTGKAAHNTNVTDVSPPYGGYPKFVSQGLNEDFLPLWLQNAGYNTYYTGKLFNAHTVENYDSPHVNGFTGSDFLLDPFTYQYLNSTFQRNKDPPVRHDGAYLSDLLNEKAYGFLEDAIAEESPFFLTIAPIAPHSNVDFNGPARESGKSRPKFTAPIPAERHAHLFPDAKVPRTGNFNPKNPSGVNWIQRLPYQSQENVDFNDEYYRNRLRALQVVDELVDGVVSRLEDHDVLDDTYIIYSSDNGYHIGQHRLQPGKQCGFEEDINVPLIIRGPGVPKNITTEIVTTHTDLAPTILSLVGAQLRTDFDGEVIPTTKTAIEAAVIDRHEHVNVEYWGLSLNEGETWGYDPSPEINTYKGLRLVGKSYSFYYSVWCNNEHELYNLLDDPGQLKNLLGSKANMTRALLGRSTYRVAARLDALLFVLKSCKGRTCIEPWQALHPVGNVNNLQDALSPEFDDFYETQQKKVKYDRCELGYFVEAEGPQFERHGMVYRDGNHWSHWV